MPDLGCYQVLSVLGEGAFARTLKASHRLLGTLACLKVAREADHHDLFLHEARLLWELHHPCLPTLRDAFFAPGGALVLAMRFVEGQPLDRSSPLDSPTAARVLGRLLGALKVLHHRGIVHNDIKPANIILEPDRHGVVLVDFGLSSLRPRSRSLAAGFTPAFVAPEVAAGRPPVPESDLYSLGLSLLCAMGADVEARVLPDGAHPDLLELLVDLSQRDPERRPRWDRRDPLERATRLLREL